MKAQVVVDFGMPHIFQYQEVPIPLLRPGFVLIRVKATSVNQIDCKIRSGAASSIAPVFPAILHGDVAGIIESVGDGVHQFKQGDEVYGCAGGVLGSSGALAEYLLADARLIAKKPKKLSFLESAALPLVGITAWEALMTQNRLKPAQNVLIHGGVGGVGHLAVQLAHGCGARVCTTILKPEDMDLAKSFGASEVILAKEESVSQYVERLTKGVGFEVVFDTVGGSNLDASFEAAAPEGLVVTTAARSTHDLTHVHQKGLTLQSVFMLLPLLRNVGRERHGVILEQMASLVDRHQLKPLIDTNVFTLQNISEAHAFVESGKARGKVVVSLE